MRRADWLKELSSSRELPVVTAARLPRESWSDAFVSCPDRPFEVWPSTTMPQHGSRFASLSRSAEHH
jgi:hypothetical protein